MYFIGCWDRVKCISLVALNKVKCISLLAEIKFNVFHWLLRSSSMYFIGC